MEKKVLLSDECNFELVTNSGRTFVRKSKDGAYKKKNLQFKTQGEKLMVWDIISEKGIGPLVRTDPIEEDESTLNGQRYLRILQ